MSEAFPHHSDTYESPLWPPKPSARAASHNIQSFLELQARARPHDSALFWAQSAVAADWRAGRRRDMLHHALSFQELQRKVSAVAHGFRELGIAHGDRVMVTAPNGPELYIALMATQRLGAIPVLLDNWERPRLVEQCAREVDPRAFVGPATSFALLGSVPALHDVPIRIGIGTHTPSFFSGELSAFAQRSQGCEPVAVLPEDGALVRFSTHGGTLSTGALHTHRSLMAQSVLFAEMVPDGDEEIELSISLPRVLTNLTRGVASVVPAVDPAAPDQYDGQALVE
ncbi:MAG: AMP-binding protein, partial [Myxococcota bacterium]